MYICHVSDVHLPNFLIVESLYPMILSAMAPPAWRECAPIKSGSIPLSCRLSDFAAVRTAPIFHCTWSCVVSCILRCVAGSRMQSVSSRQLPVLVYLQLNVRAWLLFLRLRLAQPFVEWLVGRFSWSLQSIFRWEECILPLLRRRDFVLQQVGRSWRWPPTLSWPTELWLDFHFRKPRSEPWR